MWLKCDTLTVIALSVSELLAVDIPVAQSQTESQDIAFTLIFTFIGDASPQVNTVFLQSLVHFSVLIRCGHDLCKSVG